MENYHSSSPTNNANISNENSISANHINELQIIAVLSNNDSNGDQTKSAEEIEAYIKSFPPGYRFCPTDDELVTHYLKRKIDNLPLQPNKIYEMNIYNYNPEMIAAHVKPTTEEKVWYILTPRDRKYPNGKRPSRSAGDGYWKATGADKPIKDPKRTIVGFKKALVFYLGKAQKGKKTDWIMHEYRVPGIPNLAEREAGDQTLDDWVLCKIYKKSDRDNTMFTQRKRSRDYEYIGEVLDTYDGQVHESSNENLSSHIDTFSESAGQDSTRHSPTNCIDMLCNLNNHATTFHPQIPTRFSNLAQSSHMPTFCNMPWSTTSAYDYQNCVPQFNGVLDEGTSMTNDTFHQCAPSPMMIEPISSARATSSSIRQDHTMKSEGFGVPCFSSCTSGGYTMQECYGEYLGHEKLNNNADQCDPMDCVDQYLVNYEMNNSTMYLPENNTKNVVNGESGKSNGDC
ncbi:NAC domain-containing protein 19-like [Lycium barbarum]|uniref:NAC domain-containing protein 19-like n=1 Tax=Lycium barbarum TaxID=112863 RepID=UPI00293EF1DF|nr:NAC domain-containing protein 19-like [Lycium barbarum]